MVIVRTLLIALAISPIAAAADWSHDIELVKDMVVFDKAYIRTLLAAREGDRVELEAAVEELADSWGTFEAKWKGALNKKLRVDFERLDVLVARTKYVVEEGEELDRLIRALAEMRQIFIDLRRYKKIVYFMDFVWHIERALGVVDKVVSTGVSKTLSAGELELVEGWLLIAQSRWTKMTTTRFDKIVYRIDIYYMGDFASTKAEGTVLFEKLKRDLRTLDRDELAVRVKKVEELAQHFLEILGSTPGN